jgi:hypothetical protein
MGAFIILVSAAIAALFERVLKKCGWYKIRERPNRLTKRSVLLAINMTEEFKQLLNDPDLEKSDGPRGTLVFQDGDQFCVIGPNFVSMEKSDCYAFGATREEAIANYARKMK